MFNAVGHGCFKLFTKQSKELISVGSFPLKPCVVLASNSLVPDQLFHKDRTVRSFTDKFQNSFAHATFEVAGGGEKKALSETISGCQFQRNAFFVLSKDVQGCTSFVVQPVDRRAHNAPMIVRARSSRV